MGLVKEEVEIMNMFGGKFWEKWIKALSSKLQKQTRSILQILFIFK